MSKRSDDGLTHTAEDGAIDMVDIGRKDVSRRRAVARGEIHLRPTTIDTLGDDETEKGSALATARIAAVQAVKRTWEAIPMCHQISITNVETTFEVSADRLEMRVAVESVGQTGCEMEALHGVGTGLTTIWDMVKSIEKADDGTYPSTRISDIEVVSKTKTPVDET